MMGWYQNGWNATGILGMVMMVVVTTSGSVNMSWRAMGRIGVALFLMSV